MNMFSMVAPIIGGLMYDHLNYHNTMNYHIFLELGCALIYIIFNCSCDVFAKDRENKFLIAQAKAIKNSAMSFTSLSSLDVGV